jgi:hypothetical protein
MASGDAVASIVAPASGLLRAASRPPDAPLSIWAAAGEPEQPDDVTAPPSRTPAIAVHIRRFTPPVRVPVDAVAIVFMFDPLARPFSNGHATANLSRLREEARVQRQRRPLVSTPTVSADTPLFMG